MNSERSTIEIRLSEYEKSISKELGVTYSIHLKENFDDTVIIMEIFNHDECVFEAAYSCLSFAGYHDSDTWDNALEHARTDYLFFLKKIGAPLIANIKIDNDNLSDEEKQLITLWRNSPSLNQDVSKIILVMGIKSEKDQSMTEC